MSEPINTNESFYDTEIAPVLAELAKKCDEKGMPFLCAVGNEKDTFTTLFARDMSNPSIRISRLAIKSLGNVDILIKNIIKDADEYGHNSVFVEVLKRRAEDR